MRIKYIPFSKLPYSDTCWSLIEGPDEKVYAAACCEHSSGGTAFIIRYDPRREQLEYLLDVAEVVGQPPINGRPTQCKIHYSMIIDDEGILYAATHLSGPAISEICYNPWGSFDDSARSFVGSRLLAYDTRKETVLWTDTLIPWEGCRCLALDRAARRIYALGYPRDHLYVYDLDSRQRFDAGRIGSVNPQTIWLQAISGQEQRVWTTDDDGRLIVYDPEAQSIITTDLRTPHAPYQTGWHNLVYDVVQVPGSSDVAGVAWNVDPYLFRLGHAEDPNAAVVQDMGPVSPGISGYGNRGLNTDHVGGLVFSAAGELLFSVGQLAITNATDIEPAKLKAMNLATGESRDVCELRGEDGAPATYISRAVRIGPEHLVMGTVGRVPTGIMHIQLDGDMSQGPFEATPRRYWG